MRFGVILVDESGGLTDNNTGGNESLGPPVGGMIFAHPDKLLSTASIGIAIRNPISGNLEKKCFIKSSKLSQIGCTKR